MGRQFVTFLVGVFFVTSCVPAEKPIAKGLMKRFLAALEEEVISGEGADIMSIKKRGPAASEIPALTAAQILAQDFSDVKDKPDHTKHHTIDEKLGGGDDERPNSERAGIEKRLAITDESDQGYWIKGIVPYQFGAGFQSQAKRDQIYKAMQDIMDTTCIKFQPYTQPPPTPEHNRARVVFQDVDGGCYSDVGMFKWPPGGPQGIQLEDACMYHGVILHETMHALGVQHTQTRYDRDQYIKVHLDRVSPGHTDQFIKIDSIFSFGNDLPYDYLSVMHYGSRDSSERGDRTMTTKDTCYMDIIGKANVMSFGDIKLLNKMYKCGEECPADNRCRSPCFLAKTGNSGASCECICPKADQCGKLRALGSRTNMGTGNPPVVTTTRPTRPPTTRPPATRPPTTKAPKRNCYTVDSDGAAIYTGTKSRAISGRCQYWNNTDFWGNKGLIKNYCRNPDGDTQPWCMIRGGWDYCDIPRC